MPRIISAAPITYISFFIFSTSVIDLSYTINRQTFFCKDFIIKLQYGKLAIVKKIQLLNKYNDFNVFFYCLPAI